MRKRTALELQAAQDPTTGTISTPLFRGYNGMIRGSVADGTSPELVGKRGRIWLYDEERIAVWWSCRGWFEMASEAPGAEIFCRGDGEGTILLPNSEMATAARLIQARKRRKVSEEQRVILAERGRAALAHLNRLKDTEKGEIQDFEEGGIENTALLSQAGK